MRHRPWAAYAASIVFCLSLLSPYTAHAQAQYRALYQFAGNCWMGQMNFQVISGLVADSKGDLYGTRVCDGESNFGTVFELSYLGDGGWRYSTIYTFPLAVSGPSPGGFPQGGLTVDESGNLYGTASEGGAYGCGVVYRLRSDSFGHWTETVLYNFGSLPQEADGCVPLAGVIVDHKGNLYGTTSGDSMTGPAAVAFELSPTSNGMWSETVLHNFGSPGPYGFGPNSGLVFDRAGNLYGMTPMGGQYNKGTVFELSPRAAGTWTEILIYQFGDAESSPCCGVVLDSAGNLYGSAGGTNDPGGEVYKLSPQSDGTWSYSILYIFPLSGNNPIFGPDQLSFDPRGILYGVVDSGGDSNSGECPMGCGAVFRLIPGLGTQWIYQEVYAFTGLQDGGVAMGPVIFDAEGNVYGTTLFGGGPDGDGTIFQILVQ